MIKLIASDLDGTLMLDHTLTISDEAFKLIRRLKEEKNILFVAASGRQYPCMRRLFAPVADDIGYICENGCFAMLDGKMLHQEIMDRETGLELINDILSRDGEELLLSGLETCYVAPKSDYFLPLIRDYVKNVVTVPEDIRATKEPYFKIAFHNIKGFEEHLPFYLEKYQDRCTVVSGGNNWIDCMPNGVTKRTSMEVLTKHLGIDPSECVVFGDNCNDREMLEFAGIPVSMKTAVPEIREQFPRHTDTVENALRAILEDRF